RRRPAHGDHGHALSGSRALRRVATPGASAATARAPSLLLHFALPERPAGSRGLPPRDCPPPLWSQDRPGARGRAPLGPAGRAPLPAVLRGAAVGPADRGVVNGPDAVVAACGARR